MIKTDNWWCAQRPFKLKTLVSTITVILQKRMQMSLVITKGECNENVKLLVWKWYSWYEVQELLHKNKGEGSSSKKN